MDVNHLFLLQVVVYTEKNGNNSRHEGCKTQPLTAYAKSKIIIENYLKKT